MKASVDSHRFQVVLSQLKPEEKPHALGAITVIKAGEKKERKRELAKAWDLRFHS